MIGPFRLFSVAVLPFALIACGEDEPENKAAAVEACPTTTTDLRGRTEPLVCSCEPSKAGYGVIFGGGPYLDGTGICMAARHAGILKEEKVTLSLQMEADYTGTLPGSEANGVKAPEYNAKGKHVYTLTAQ